MNRGLTFLSEMTDHNGPGPAEPRTGEAERQSAGRAVDRRQLRRWVPLTAGVTSLFVGLGYIVVGINPGLTERRLKGLSYLGSLTRTADIIIGLLLLMVSHGLRRRKRRAWEAVLALLGTGVLVHVAVGFIAYIVDPDGARPAFRPVSTAISVLLISLLIWFRREFYAVGDPRTRWRALWVLGYLAVADIAIGLGYLSVSRGLLTNYSPWQRIESVVFSLVGFSGPVQFKPGSGADHFAFVTGALGLFTLVVTAFMFLRPARRASRMSSADAARIRQLLARHGDQDSLGYFALRNDKSIIWSPSGKACIGYRVLSGVMLASGDPIGDAEAWPGAINTFLDEAGRHAWVPGSHWLQRTRCRGLVPGRQPDGSRARR